MDYYSSARKRRALKYFGITLLLLGGPFVVGTAAQQGISVRYNAVWRPSTVAEIQVYGSTYEGFRAKYNELWKQGWRLHILQAYVVKERVLYNAVWRPSTMAEIQVYGSTYEGFRAKYDGLWINGWRLHILQAYVVKDQVLYNAVWRPSTVAETQVYRWTYQNFKAKYDELWGYGWRLHILQAYVVKDRVLYNAVWRPSTVAETQVYGWTYQNFKAKYDELWGYGWRLHILQAYVVKDRVLYNAVWRHSTVAEIQVYGSTYEGFRANYNELWKQGWRLRMLEAYTVSAASAAEPQPPERISTRREDKNNLGQKEVEKQTTLEEFDRLSKPQQEAILSQSGPLLPHEYSMNDIPMRVFVRGSWPIVVAYSLKPGGSALITITVDGIEPFSQTFDPGENKQVVIRLPDRFGERPQVAKLSIKVRRDSTGAFPSFDFTGIGIATEINKVAFSQLEAFQKRVLPTSIQANNRIVDYSHSSSTASMQAMQLPLGNILLQPDMIRTSRRESVTYKFLMKSSYSGGEAEFFLFTLIGGEVVPKRVFFKKYGRIRANEETMQQAWDGRKWDGSFSYGLHRLEIRTWRGLRSGGEWFGPFFGPKVQVLR